jgi:hypothetical protein
MLKATLAALALSAVLCSSAAAAVSFEFTSTANEPATINRGDEFAAYSVVLKNTGTDPTVGPTTVAVTLPSGVMFASAAGSGWSCSIAAQSCTHAASVGPGASFGVLKVRTWVVPEEAPETVTATFTTSGGGAPAAMAQQTYTQGPQLQFGFTAFSVKATDEAGLDHTQAGGHPYTAASFLTLPTRTLPHGKEGALESVRDLNFALPPGFIGNPRAIDERCTVNEVKAGSCPESAAIGGAHLEIVNGAAIPADPVVFNVVPPAGYPAAFALRPVPGSPATYVVLAKVRSNGDYGVTAVTPLPPQPLELLKLDVVRLCGYGARAEFGTNNSWTFKGCKVKSDPDSFKVPFVTNPTRCQGPPPSTRVEMDSYQNPGAIDAEGFPVLADPDWKTKEALSPPLTGCAALSEAWVGKGPAPTPPTLSFQPDSARAAAPAAYTAQLRIPQPGLTEVDGLATAHLKDTRVVLPEGLALNPSAAAGLGACSEAQAGLLGTGFPEPNPIRFTTTSAGCPENSRIGAVKVSTPLLDKPLPGSVYLAAQDANPFGSRFAIYLVIEDAEDSGIKATLAGQVQTDPASGQITTVFRDNPQVPVEELGVRFFGGPRASLANPDLCAPYTTRTELTPWSAADPYNPTAAETAVSLSAVAIDTAPEGRSSCPATKADRPFDLGFEAGSANPLAGAGTAFSLRISRPAGSQELDRVTVRTPPGLLAVLKGLGRCSDAALAAAQAPGRKGAAEIASPSCPSSSQVGSTTVGAGAGPNPFYVKTGKVYLTGPYQGAPLGLAFVVPAVAGPFDLGVQVVRTALHVDPRNGQVTAKSDPIPQILEGVPLNIRDVRVELDRPNFALNPTNCEAMAVTAQLSGASGATASLQNRFQVGGCEGLRFKPKLRLRLHGATRRAAYQRLVATLTAAPGEANIARTAVTFPHSTFLAQEHIRTVCTRVQFAADACPKGSVYGTATAITPLLDDPLTGPVYLRSSDNELPDLVAALRGPDSLPVEVELVGRTDSKNGGIRNTFDVVPDAPVSKFTLKLFGGQKSLLVNSRNLCKGPKQRATVRMLAHNAKRRDFRVVVGNDCGKKRKGGKKR